MRGNHIPIRTCLGCGKKGLKGTLIRIVMADGSLSVDEKGRLPGRGAYLCHEASCISSLLKKRGKLSYALHASVPRAAEDAFLTALLSRWDGEGSF